MNRVEQEGMRNILIIRNLPREIQEDQKNVQTALQNIFKTLAIDVSENDYDAYAYPTGKNSAIQATFTTNRLKEKILSKFKALRSEARRKKADYPPFLVEKIIGLPVDHELNGKEIWMANKLTVLNLKLLDYARKFVPKHFETANDMTDCVIKVKTSGGWRRIADADDVDELVSKSEKAKPKGKKQPSSPASPKVTRQSARKGKDRQ
jgi:hypothetical protein